MSKVLDIMFYWWTWPFFLFQVEMAMFLKVLIFKKKIIIVVWVKNPIFIYWSTKFMDGKGTIICINVVKQRWKIFIELVYT